MLKRSLCRVTITLLTASLCGSNSFASPLEHTFAERDDCIKTFAPSRTQAEKLGRLIRAAREGHAPTEDVCILLGNLGKAETQMIKFVEANLIQCGIPAEIAAQLRADYQNMNVMEKKGCRPARPPLVGDFDNLSVPPPVR